MLQPIGLEFLRGDTSVDIEALKRAVTVTLSTQEEEATYEQQDWRLHTQIQQVAAAELGMEIAEKLFSVADDWFPNKTKSMRCDQTSISAGLVGALQGLLQGEFSDWSLAVEVYGTSESTEQQIGPIRVYAEKVYAVQALRAHLPSGA